MDEDDDIELLLDGHEIKQTAAPHEVGQALKVLCAHLEELGHEGGYLVAVPKDEHVTYHSLVLVYGGVHKYPKPDPKGLN
jgi:hypothetical protein